MSSGSVRPPVALAFALMGFVALMIFGLGMTSLATETDVISTPGLGQFPGIFGPILAIAVFAGTLWSFVRVPHPTFWGSLVVAVATFLAYLLGVGVVALVVGADPAAAAGTVGHLATTWYGLVVFGAALVSAWAGIALARTHAGRPRWPWEKREQ